MNAFMTFGREPSLPDHCAPTTDFLLRFSSAFHVCIPTPLAFISNLFGTISIIAWLFAQLPQIYKNWSVASTSGLSIFFLVEWCLGDISNLLGALFTHQESWQVTIAGYYVFVDLCLVGQWVWYEKLKHGNHFASRWVDQNGHPNGGDSSTLSMTMEPDRDNAADPHGLSKAVTRPRIIFRAPTFQGEPQIGREKASPSPSNLSKTPGSGSIYRMRSPSAIPSPSPRTILFIACLVALTRASPITGTHAPHATHSNDADDIPATSLEIAGTILSWLSSVLYLGSRLPQLLKNWRRKSTAGLSPHLFIAAFCGNLFYSAALATNPRAWSDLDPYGGGGWVGAEGSDRVKWVMAALPFFLGAAGVLGLDASVGVQFLIYGESEANIKIPVPDESGQGWQWRRVSGWMRGWIPSRSREPSLQEEREALIPQETGYGTL